MRPQDHQPHGRRGQPILAGRHRRYVKGAVSDLEASLVELFGVFDDDRQETAAHRDCEGVKETRLAENDVELRVPRLDKAHLCPPGHEFVACLILMELDFNLDKSCGHRSPPDPKFESIGGVTEINPELVRQPGRSKTVFTATVDQSEDRAEVACGDSHRHNRAKDRQTSTVRLELEILEIPALGWKISQVQRAAARPVVEP